MSRISYPDDFKREAVRLECGNPDDREKRYGEERELAAPRG